MMITRRCCNSLPVLLAALSLAGCPQEVPNSGQFGADAGTATDTGTVAGTDTVADTAADAGPCGCVSDADCGPSPDPCATMQCVTCQCHAKPLADGIGCGGARTCTAGKCVADTAPWAVDIVAGGAHTCVIHGSGGVSCWGRNSQGQLGMGGASSPEAYETKAVVAVGLQDVTALASRKEHACALHEDGKVRCWGDNFRGEVGNGSTTNDIFAATLAQGLSGAKFIAAGGEFSLAIRDDKSLWGWGHGGYHKLLDATLSNASKPKKIGADLGVSGLTGICGGNTFACGIWPDFTVKCWGQGGFGEIGGGQYKYNYLAKTPEAVSNIGNIAELACGDSHVCAREASGTVWCWGRNLHRQVSDGSGDASIATPMKPAGVGKMVELALGQGHSCGRTAAGTVVCWGANDRGQLGYDGKPVANMNTISLTPPAIAIAAGFDHTCAVRQDGSVVCWGANQYGQLGNGQTEDSSIPVVVAASGG